MSVSAVETFRIDCPFCDKPHTAEFFDELEEQVMACRERLMEKARAGDRGAARKLGLPWAFDEDEFDRYTVTTESLVPR